MACRLVEREHRPPFAGKFHRFWNTRPLCSWYCMWMIYAPSQTRFRYIWNVYEYLRLYTNMGYELIQTMPVCHERVLTLIEMASVQTERKQQLLQRGEVISWGSLGGIGALSLTKLLMLNLLLRCWRMTRCFVGQVNVKMRF